MIKTMVEEKNFDGEQLLSWKIRGILLRSKTKAEWEKASEYIAPGELVIESDTNKLKIGNGFHDYENMPYVQGVGSVSNEDLTDNSTIVGILERLERLEDYFANLKYIETDANN